MERVGCVVVGAGVIGLAVARRLALAGGDVVVVEAGPSFGGGVSSRSSEVIHAGIYYPTGSLKARLCVAGRRQLYEYCHSRGVDHRRIGKFIVAADVAQVPSLETLRATASANGVDDLEVWESDRFNCREPDVTCALALYSPSTGIVDSRAYMRALLGDLEDAGGAMATRAAFERGAPLAEGGFEVRIGGDEPMSLRCDVLVNAAGLSAVAVAHLIDGLAAAHIPTARYAQGAYFSLTGVKPPFQTLIYPVPEPGGLGVHVTFDLGGQVRFGPDVAWMDAPSYDIDEAARSAMFYAAIRRYWPGLPDGALVPAYAAVRPKISGPGEPAADFLIQGPAETGLEGLVNLFGIESPGLTSSLAIADHVAGLLQV